MAQWKGDRLTLWTSVQIIKWARRDLAKILAMPAAKIRLVSPYIGGGFSGKATALSDALLAARRPVKVSLPRPLMFHNTTHRPATVQRVRLGASADGRLTAIGHESWSGNLPGGMAERSTLPTAALYAGAHRMLRTRLVPLDLPEGSAMRAPGMMAFEAAMDELAEQLGIDPVELRVLNDTQQDPGKPERQFSTRPFVACLRTGAQPFGWQRRIRQPASVRDGDWLIGMGMAAAIRGDNTKRSGARVRLDARGIVTAETDMTNIGTGSYIIPGQTAAEMLGVLLDRVVVRLGDSHFPEACGSLGQSGANSATSGVYAACVKLREAIARRQDFDLATTEFTGGEVRSASRRISLAQAALAGDIVGEDTIEFGPAREGVAHRPSARTSARWPYMRRPAKCGCGACWPCARPVASSIR